MLASPFAIFLLPLLPVAMLINWLANLPWAVALDQQLFNLLDQIGLWAVLASIFPSWITYPL